MDNNNVIKSFSNEAFGQIRILVDKNGAVWFLAREIAQALG